ncbi:MAG: hypothetical protein B6241_07685 [Spirochaetaceae bacterium 4572_59]|nr:MAG: hypothetical protein B6241_07685 [Spirochaetaceae bacterium 4572_59]
MSKTNLLFDIQDIQVLTFLNKHKEVWRNGDLSAPYWRLIHNNKGISELFFKRNIENRRVSLPKEILIIVPPGIEYSCSNTSPVDHMEITFSLSGPPLSVLKSYLSFPYEKESKTIIETLIHSPGNHNRELPQQLILNLLRHAQSKMLIRQTSNDERLNQAIMLMKDNPERPLSNSFLAEKASMSVNGFARLFREKMGRTPYEYQLILRIEKACILLQYSDKSIEMIAEESGFTNRFHFSKAFKNIQLISPVQFRKVKNLNSN